MAIRLHLDISVTIIFQQKSSKSVNYKRSYFHFCVKKLVLKKRQFYI